MRQRLFSIIFILVLFVGWILFAPWLANRLPAERRLEYADAIIVLSGSYVYKERTEKAAELYRRGIAPKIFITNDGERDRWSKDENANRPFVELEQEVLIANGVPREAIIVLPKLVAGTDEEAFELVNNLDVYSIRSVVVVTSGYHSRRALWTFDKIVGSKGAVVGLEYADPSERTPDPNYWWLMPRGWQMVAGEYIKSVVYRAYY